MGLNDENARRIVFDIETATLPDAASFLEEPIPPANYRDPAVIQKYVEEKRAELLDKCALDLDLCQIVAVGWMAEGEPPMVLTQADDPEGDILRTFWSVVRDRHLIGFNCLQFDLPVLMRRSQYLALQYPSIGIDRFRHPTVTDLQMVLSFNGVAKWRSLSFYAKRFGLDVGPDALTGADIGAAVRDGRWDDVRTHCRADILKTAALAARLHVFEDVGVV